MICSSYVDHSDSPDEAEAPIHSTRQIIRRAKSFAQRFCARVVVVFVVEVAVVEHDGARQDVAQATGIDTGMVLVLHHA